MKMAPGYIPQKSIQGTTEQVAIQINSTYILPDMQHMKKHDADEAVNFALFHVANAIGNLGYVVRSDQECAEIVEKLQKILNDMKLDVKNAPLRI